jgi:uncharacterized protein (TIGR02453 family)
MDALPLEFLTNLRLNNNRDWFNENKAVYEKSRKIVEMFITELIGELSAFDKRITGVEARQAMFRIYRDVRFSKDKTPYKTAMGSYMAPGGRKSVYAGYYVHIEPGNCFLAGGMYAPPADSLYKIRQEIVYKLDEYKKLISSKSFNKYFGEVKGDKLKRPPKGFPSEFKEVELIKNKDFILVHNITDGMIVSDELLTYSVEVFKALKKYNDFLNRSLD